MKKRPNYNKYLIIDGFAGGGGASVGIEMALGRSVDIAINHDPAAILMHKTNHPHTIHLTEDIFKVDLQKYTKGRHVGLAWFSPDCRSFSKAKGSAPRSASIRMLPWAVFHHAQKILPDVIIMENVEEIQQWGPLDESGRPIKELEGTEYNRFITAMKSLGYVFDSKELVAADYGAPTTRKRWYAIFRRDGLPIVWPKPTHSKDGINRLKPWVPVSSVLDFSNIGKSIFGRKKPLADKTMNRIARGFDKYVVRNADPFIIQVGYGERKGQKPRCNSINQPLGTIVAGAVKHALITPALTPFVDKAYAGNYKGCGSATDNPLSAITTVDHNRLITPYIIQYHSEKNDKDVRGQEVNRPIQTIDTSNRYAQVSAFLTKFYKTGTGQSIDEPLHTITTSPGHFGMVSVLTVKLEDLIKAGVDEETAQKCTWVSKFLIEYYGTSIASAVTDPLPTITTKDRFALITILGDNYAVLDIYLRMLTPEELKMAQGFPKDYIIDRDYRWRPYPIKEQVARIGNSVVPVMAKALVEANCGYMKVGERAPGFMMNYPEVGQISFA